MERRPAIAVAAPNVLMGVGMKSILEKIIPAADVELFGDFESFTEANPERFFHFFVAAQLFVTHGSFFRARRSKTILLCSGHPQPAYADMHCIDVCTNEEAIVRDILRMHHGAHRVPGRRSTRSCASRSRGRRSWGPAGRGVSVRRCAPVRWRGCRQSSPRRAATAGPCPA